VNGKDSTFGRMLPGEMVGIQQGKMKMAN